MIDLKKRKSDWSATSAKGGQFKSAKTGQFGRHVQHTAKIVPPEEAGKELPWVHITISNAKRNLLNCYHHVDDIFLQNYLDEFTYKLNRRFFGEKIFDRLIIACSSFSWAA